MRNLLRSQQVAGASTFAAVALGFALANSPAREVYQQIHHLPIMVRVGTFVIDKPLILWINDGLMTFFFLLIALQLKREVLEGQLSTWRAIAAPGFAALGGMVVPALLYAVLNRSDPSALRGWAIPTATDTVLVLTVLALLGARVPATLKVFLTALAIFDDLGAILVIALFYTEGLAISSLVMAAIGVAVLVGLNVCRVKRTAAYVIVGVFLWVAMLKSGVHATLAGVAIGVAIPMRVTHHGRSATPMRDAEHQLYPWVALGVVPLFALFNSGIRLSTATSGILGSTMSVGIVLGLFVGKQLGIFGSVWLAARAGVARLPQAVGWRQLYGMAVLAGIGFTMSLFIAGLAFPDPAVFEAARLSIVIGSLCSAAGGAVVLWLSDRHRRHAAR